ncbi:MAG: class I SAM-dependent methyltransferase [Actinomycetota bacterium]
MGDGENGHGHAVGAAYTARAAEYIEHFGDVSDTDERDRARVARWADEVSGPVLDAGCGPGQWSSFLHGRGVSVSGVDIVPSFIERARLAFPAIAFRTGALADIDIPDGSLGGVLAWYSLIHADPDELTVILREFRRTLAPGGRLLVGFFDGVDEEKFPHAVVPARYWSVEGMARVLGDAGFTVLGSETRQDPDRRPHASISAVAH